MTARFFTAHDGWIWRRTLTGWHTILPRTAERLLCELGTSPENDAAAVELSDAIDQLKLQRERNIA